MMKKIFFLAMAIMIFLLLTSCNENEKTKISHSEVRSDVKKVTYGTPSDLPDRTKDEALTKLAPYAEKLKLDMSLEDVNQILKEVTLHKGRAQDYPALDRFDVYYHLIGDYQIDVQFHYSPKVRSVYIGKIRALKEWDRVLYDVSSEDLQIAKEIIASQVKEIVLDRDGIPDSHLIWHGDFSFSHEDFQGNMELAFFEGVQKLYKIRIRGEYFIHRMVDIGFYDMNEKYEFVVRVDMDAKKVVPIGFIPKKEELEIVQEIAKKKLSNDSGVTELAVEQLKLYSSKGIYRYSPLRRVLEIRYQVKVDAAASPQYIILEMNIDQNHIEFFSRPLGWK